MAPDAPLRERSIVCVSTIDWDFLWQSHQELMTRFADMGNQVFFLENTGVRTVRLSDLARVVQRLVRGMRDAGGHRQPARNVTVLAPLLLPFPGSRAANALNRAVFLPRLASTVRRLAGPQHILFTYLPTPNALTLTELLRRERALLVYYCIADFQELSDIGPALRRSEDEIVRRADLVFVQGAPLFRRFTELNRHVHEFWTGVNLALYDPSRVTGRHPDIDRLPRPILGYSGGLHRHVDFGLLTELARAMPQASIVLVGPVQSEPASLRALPNVYLLGMRAARELPSLVASFDVGLVPYVRTAYTETVQPTKVFEYLAMGKPVVSTDLPELERLRLPPAAVRLARHTDEFVDAVRASLVSDDLAGPVRRALARDRDWDAIAMRMADLMAERLTDR